MQSIPVDREYIKETDAWFEYMETIGNKIDRLHALREWAIEIENLSGEYTSLPERVTFPMTREGFALQRAAEAQRREVELKVNQMFVRARRELPRDTAAKFSTTRLSEGPTPRHLCNLLMNVLFALEAEWCKVTKQEPMELKTWKLR